MPLREVITREFAPVTAPLDEVVAWVLEHARVRAGFREFVEQAQSGGWDVHVVSSGFHELIEPVLEREGVDVLLHANRVDASTERLARRLAVSGRLRSLQRVVQAGAAPGRVRGLRRRRLLRPVRRARLRSRLRDLRSRPLPRRARYPLRAFHGLPRPLGCARQRNRYAAFVARLTSRRLSAARNRRYVLAMETLSLPEPYDFELSTARYRAFGTGPREPLARGRAASRRRRPRGADHRGAGRSRRRPARRRDRAGRAQAPRRRVRPRRVLRIRSRASRRSPDWSKSCAGCDRRSRSSRSRALVTSITAQQVSLAGGVRDPEPPDRALRRPRRACVRVPDARADR